jgi:hypothetical protein
MKLKLFFLIIISLSNFCFSQETITKFEPIQLIKTRQIYLNGGTKAMFGGKSREYIKIDLPPNTTEWYYSFSTSPGISGTKNINLFAQVASTFATKTSMIGNIMSATGITKEVAKAVQIPEGSNSADIYLCDRANIDKFLAKEDQSFFGSSFSYTMEGTVQNTKQALVQINDIISGTVYLGLKNPSAMDGMNVSIEVVAIVKTETKVEKSENQQKAELFGNLGWKQFQNGNYEKCIEYSAKSKNYQELGWVMANVGLSQLMLNKEIDAMETYVNAITLIKKQNNSKYFLTEAAKDLETILLNNPKINGASEIKQIIESEIK